MIRRKAKATDMYKYWIDARVFYREHPATGEFERWSGRAWREVAGADGAKIAFNGTLIPRSAAKQLYPNAIRGTGPKNVSTRHALRNATVQPADFSDPESQRVLEAAACAVAFELGREAGREYFARLIGKTKVSK